MKIIEYDLGFIAKSSDVIDDFILHDRLYVTNGSKNPGGS
jgi:hypothetical protein